MVANTNNFCSFLIDKTNNEMSVAFKTGIILKVFVYRCQHTHEGRSIRNSKITINLPVMYIYIFFLPLVIFVV